MLGQPARIPEPQQCATDGALGELVRDALDAGRSGEATGAPVRAEHPATLEKGRGQAHR